MVVSARAWEYIRRAERALGVTLTGSVPGKGANRGTALADYGVTILETLTALGARVDSMAGISGPTREEVASRGRPARRSRTRARPQSWPLSTGSERFRKTGAFWGVPAFAMLWAPVP